jgi:plastocyanin
MNSVRTVVGTAMLVAVLAACSGGGSAASVSPPPETDVTVTAQGNAFDPKEFHVPAGAPFQLFFRNLDGAPHNVAVYIDATATNSIYVGEVITDAATLYEMPALEPGTYPFRCDVHPEMTGNVVAEG